MPVVEGGSRAQVVNAAIVNSPLWKHVKVLSLTINMRLRCPDLSIDAQTEIAEFSRWVLDIGEGSVDAIRKDSETDASWVKISRELVLMPQGDKIASIVEAVYPELSTRYSERPYLQNRAILTPTK